MLEPRVKDLGTSPHIAEVDQRGPLLPSEVTCKSPDSLELLFVLYVHILVQRRWFRRRWFRSN